MRPPRRKSPLKRLPRRTSPPRTIPPLKTLNVAITGGIGAGKSEALRAFARHGAATASADEIVHRLYADPDVRQALVERWGEGVLSSGEVDRTRVGEIVFADRGELAWLESLLHPRVVDEQARWRAEQTAPLAVVEVPLLYETGGEARFDAVVVITAPEETRRARTDVADVAERQGRLLSDEEKAGKADFVYVNDGSLEDLDAFVRGVVQRLAP
ncbi:MAG TPA: dephospho-CoA kinase [Gaiellaceae bacterium]|nr:dephospho-CoA kinase [Gaiellaceae bacterium]